MKKFTNLILTLLTAYPVICLTLSSCTDESDCSIAGRSVLRCTVQTLSEETGKPIDHTLEWLTVTALGTDSILVNADEEVSDVFLPLQYTVDSTAIILHYSAEDLLLTDTLIIRHLNTPYFVSMDCGYDMKQKINEVEYTRHVLDSIHMVSANTSNNGTRNLQLFY